MVNPMDGNVPNEYVSEFGTIENGLDPSHIEKTPGAMKATRAVRRITFTPSEANPGETLYVRVPKLNENEVLVPNSLALIFDVDLSGGTRTTFLSRMSRGRSLKSLL